MTSKENETVINVSPRLNVLDQNEENHQEQHDTDVTISPVEPPALADELENGTSLLNKGNPVTKRNVPDIHQSSDSYANESEGPAAKTRKLSDGSSEARESVHHSSVYHSHTSQLMTLEEVKSDRDSNDGVDYYILDIKENQTLFKLEDKSPDGKRLMFLWNSFVRKQRVFADGDVPRACEAFSKFHKEELIDSKLLHWCWRLFLLKLWNYKLLTAVTFDKCNLIIEDIKNNSDNTNNNNSLDHDTDLNRNSTMDANDNSVDGGIDLNSNETVVVNKNCVGRDIDLNSYGPMDVNKNSVGRGIDLNSFETVDANKNSVDRGTDLNNNDVTSVGSNSVNRGNDLNCNDVMCVNKNSVDRDFDLNQEYVPDVDEDVNDNEDK